MKTRDYIVAGATGIWAILVAINESGVLDIMPIEDEKVTGWIKFTVAIFVIAANALAYKGKK